MAEAASAAPPGGETAEDIKAVLSVAGDLVLWNLRATGDVEESAARTAAFANGAIEEILIAATGAGEDGEDRQPPAEPPKAPEPDQPPPDEAKPGGGVPGKPPRKPDDPGEPPKKPDDPEAPPRKPGPDDPKKPNPCQTIKDVLATVNRQILEIRQEITGKEGEIAGLEEELAELKELKDKDIPIDEGLLKRMETATDPTAKLLRRILPRLVVREIDKSFDPALRHMAKNERISVFEEKIAGLKRKVEKLHHKEENKLKNEDFWRKQLAECEAKNR